MNIFYLDHDVNKCAEYHCDKHVVKMLVEYAQLLSTCHRLLDGEKIKIIQNNRKVTKYFLKDERNNILYKDCHQSHPCQIWLKSSKENYIWLYKMWVCLANEFTLRYQKNHLSYEKLKNHLINPPLNIPSSSFTNPALAMPEDCKSSDPIYSYRKYYILYKKEFATWKTKTPDWFI